MMSISHIVEFPYLFVASAEKQMETKISLKNIYFDKSRTNVAWL